MPGLSMDPTDRPAPALPGRLLAPFPRATSIIYAVMGSLPVYLVGAHSERLQEELGFGTAGLAYATTGYFVASGLSAVALGPALDRRRGAGSFRLASALSAAAALAVAWLANGWQALAACLAVSGVANTVAQLACNRLLAKRLASGRQALGFAAKQAAIPLSSLLAGMAASLAGPDLPYRVTFTAFAGFALVAVALAPAFPGGAPGSAPVPAGSGGMRRVLVALAVAGGLGAVASNALAVLVVDAFADGGFSEAAATAVMTLGSAASIAARLGVGWEIDRRGGNGFGELTVLTAAGAAGLLLLALGGSNRPVLFTGVLLAFAAGWGWPAVIYFTAARHGGDSPATATAFVLAGVFAGTVVGPALIGVQAEHLGYRTAWLTGSAALCLACLTVVAARRLATAARAEAAPSPGETRPGDGGHLEAGEPQPPM